MSLLVVGSMAFDSVQTPFGAADNALGGSATYLSIAASFFAPVYATAAIGEDFPPEQLHFLRSKGIDTTGIVQLPGKTFRWSARYGSDLSNAETLATDLNVLSQFKADIPASQCTAPYVMLGNIDPKLQHHVLRQLTGARLVACDTMNYWIRDHLPALTDLLQHIDLLCINEGEARLLAKEPNLRKAAQWIQSMGPRYLIIKRGEYGALLFCPDGMFAAPGFPLEDIADPTGAGDTFAGGVMGYLAAKGELSTQYLRQAVIMGSVMASFVVEDFSFRRLLTLNQQHIQERLYAFHQLIQYDTDGFVTLHPPASQRVAM